VVTSMERSRFQDRTRETIEVVLRNYWKELAPSLTDVAANIDWVGVKTQIERELVRMLKREMQSAPLLVFLMQTTDAPATRKVSKDPVRKVEAAIAS